MKGKPTSNTIITKHNSLNGNPTLTASASSVVLNILFKNDLPKGAYKYVFDEFLRPQRALRFFCTVSAVGLDTRPRRYTLTRAIITRAMKDKIMLREDIFIEDMVPISILQENFDTLETTLRTSESITR